MFYSFRQKIHQLHPRRSAPLRFACSRLPPPPSCALFLPPPARLSTFVTFLRLYPCPLPPAHRGGVDLLICLQLKERNGVKVE